MSFDVEDDGAAPSFGPSTTKEKHRDKDKDRDRDRERKKRKEEPVQQAMDVDLDDDSMWVEKPPPEVVKNLVMPPDSRDGRDAGSQRGRKRAIDFM